MSSCYAGLRVMSLSPSHLARRLWLQGASAVEQDRSCVFIHPLISIFELVPSRSFPFKVTPDLLMLKSAMVLSSD